MAYRQLPIGFFNRYFDGLSLEAAGLYALLLQDERLRPAGLFRVTLAELWGELGTDKETIESALTELQDRVIYKDRWVFFPLHASEQGKGSKWEKGVTTNLAESRAPDWILDEFTRVHGEALTCPIDTPSDQEREQGTRKPETEGDEDIDSGHDDDHSPGLEAMATSPEPTDAEIVHVIRFFNQSEAGEHFGGHRATKGLKIKIREAWKETPELQCVHAWKIRILQAGRSEKLQSKARLKSGGVTLPYLIKQIFPALEISETDWGCPTMSEVERTLDMDGRAQIVKLLEDYPDDDIIEGFFGCVQTPGQILARIQSNPKVCEGLRDQMSAKFSPTE